MECKGIRQQIEEPIDAGVSVVSEMVESGRVRLDTYYGMKPF